MAEYEQLNMQNVSTETKWSRIPWLRHGTYAAGSTDNHRLHREKKTSHVADTDFMLLDKLNTIYAHFEDNTVPPTQPATKDCGLSSVADVSKTV